MSMMNKITGIHGALYAKLFVQILIDFAPGSYLEGCQQKTGGDERGLNIDVKIVAPPNGGVYLGAYDFDDGIETFEQAIGRKMALENPSYIQDGGTEGTLPFFYRAGHEKAHQEGYITTFEIECKISSPIHSPQAVINGAFDNELKKEYQKLGQANTLAISAKAESTTRAFNRF